MRDADSWAREKLLSAGLVRASCGLLGALCAAWALAGIVLSAKAATEARYEPAIIQFLSGLAAPFAIWLAVRLIADLVILQHRQTAGAGRTHDRAPSHPASDDGPNYEVDES